MPFEVELKVRLRQPDVIKTRAAELGTWVGAVFKEDVYFRRRGDTRSYPPERYRLRRQETKAIVTFKQPIQTGDIEVNEEVEFEVSDRHAFFCFADQFGFEPFVVKRKKSLVYRIGRAYVELNEVDHVGHFAEIEILCNDQTDVPEAQAEIDRILKQLGLTHDDIEPNPYILLIQAAYPVQYRFINDPTLDWPFQEVTV